MTIPPNEATTLLALARQSIGDALEGREVTRYESPSGIMSEKRGAFVTLNRDGRLRGCIGLIETDQPLCDTVARMARAAAFKDPRFPPLEKDELPLVVIEISVLTVPILVDDTDDIEVGRDGLIVERGPARGLLLPQVPGEWGWDRDEFLDQTCAKAGLEPSAWREPDTRVLRFSADVVREAV